MKIEKKYGKLIVPDAPTINYISGDGVGQDIFPQAKRLFDVAVEQVYGNHKKIEWHQCFAGQESFEMNGQYLSDETVAEISENLVTLKGPLMTPVGEGFRSLNVTLRQKLDLYACVRPVEYFDGIESPIKNPQNVDITIFRENTEDIYAGIEFASRTPEAQKLIKFISNELQINKIRFPESSAIGVKPVSPEGTKRLVRAAFDEALKKSKQRVTFVHKGNIMKFTEGGFRKWAYEIASDYPTFTKLEFDQIKAKSGIEAAKDAKGLALSEGKIFVDDVIADNFLQQIIIHPENFEIVATLNLNGDYISDALAAEVGGIGIAPGANINFETGHAIFEATHGTAPDIAGQGKANPSSLILSGLMMFDYLGWTEVSKIIKKAMVDAFKEGRCTSDLGGSMSTSEFTDVLISHIQMKPYK
ncbi:NADP-dependent isocitrate dehydrogenase [Lactococcus fujiensis]|uniref:Isocitrate dehydrogenase [NADP] n=1 Tax=Lactococcus fujiensis JCM 16395 TaxID=1291764 RepID=A0A2A5RNX1_9LACT|nr:NADP-dependent isocitrate dehydrogenase [Lactococcus fujiensis]PCS01041.1 isocitrate dehydrogenase [Lactococcus fujiensis JCM 16395]